MSETCQPGQESQAWGYEYDRREQRDIPLCDICHEELDTEYVPGLEPVDIVATHRLAQPSDNPT